MSRFPRASTIAVALTVLLAIPAFLAPHSQATRVYVTIRGRPLGFSYIETPTLAPVDISGLDQITTGTLGLFDLRDARGTGAGWNLVVQSTDFINRDNVTRTIAATGFIINAAPSVATVAGNSTPQSFSGPLSSPLKLLSASPNSGMGHFLTSPQTRLTVPASTYAGTYDSTLSVTMLSGP